MKKVVASSFIFVFFLTLVGGSAWAQNKQLNQNQPQVQIMQQTVQQNEGAESVIQERTQERVELKLETGEGSQTQERMEERKQLMLQTREEFKENLKLMRDQKKQVILGRVEERLNNTNQHISQILLDYLDRLEQISTKLQPRLEIMQSEGLDVYNQLDQLSVLKTDISALRNQITVQMEKTYTPVLEDEENVKDEVSVLHQQLQADLKNLRDQLISIKQTLGSIIHD